MGVLSLLLGSLTGVNPADNKNKTPPPPPPPPVAPTISAPAAASSPPQPPSPASTPRPPTQTPTTPPQTDYYNHYFSRRSLRQLGLFFAGTGFFYLSVMITRRAVARHKLAARLKFYEPNHQFAGWGRSAAHNDVADSMLPKKDPLVAVEALNLATLNTLAFAIAAAGGLSWGLDISTLEDLRRYARRSIVLAGAEGSPDEAAEREVAEWVAKTFGIEERKREGDGGGEGNGEGEGVKGEGEGEKKR